MEGIVEHHGGHCGNIDHQRVEERDPAHAQRPRGPADFFIENFGVRKLGSIAFKQVPDRYRKLREA